MTAEPRRDESHASGASNRPSDDAVLREATTPPSGAARLAASRQRLQAAWLAHRTHRRGGSRAATTPSWWAALPDGVGAALRRWWAEHPLREAAQLLVDAAEPRVRAALAPTAERQPGMLLAAAAALGALCVALRPWRWAPQAALTSLLWSALWPDGGPRRWLASGGLGRLLSSGALASLIAGLAASDPAPSSARAPDAPGRPDDGSPPTRTDLPPPGLAA